MLTLSEAQALFLLEDRAPSTTATYRKVLNRAVKYLGPARPIDQITKEDLLRFIQHLRGQQTRYTSHPLRPEEEGELAPRTVEKYARTLVTFFRWLENEEYLERSPASNLKVRRYQRPPGSSKAATPDELRAILRVAEAKAALGKPLHLAVFLFLCDTGCRAGEAASLTIENLLLDQGGAWVTGKGDKTRPVFYGPRTADALRAWLDVHPNPTPSASVFRMRAESISQVIARLAKAAGITRNLGAHAIRHRVGQVWASARMGEQATQIKLGHDDPSITVEMYYNTTWDYVQQASEQLTLAAIFGLPSEPLTLRPPQRILPFPKTGTGEG